MYLSDKVQTGGQNLGADIANTIAEANLAIFDITSFRPNVIRAGVLSALKRPPSRHLPRRYSSGGKHRSTTWELSDITHLVRIEYKEFKTLIVS